MAAEQGLPDAQYFLGQALEAGEGVQQNQQEAIDWYFLASEQGHVSARRRFWSLCLSGAFKPENYEEALFAELIGRLMGNKGPHFHEALRLSEPFKAIVYDEILKALGGSHENQFDLGLRYDNGDGVLRDFEAALYWYRRASINGNSGAFNNMGVIFSDPDSGKFDESKAIQCYQKAAELGSAFGMLNLADYLMDGTGIRKNVKRAINLLKSAAEKENGHSMAKLGDLYYNGKVVNLDYSEAYRWYSEAASQNLARGYFGLGLLYGQGLGVAKDLDLAKSYFEKSVDADESYASNLADFYERGVIFAADPEVALRWRDRARMCHPDDEVRAPLPLIAKPNLGRARSERLIEKRDKARRILGLFD
jgi:uncharacterized protein